MAGHNRNTFKIMMFTLTLKKCQFDMSNDLSRAKLVIYQDRQICTCFTIMFFFLQKIGTAGDTKQPIDYICEYGGAIFAICAGELPEVCGAASAVCRAEKIKHFITNIFG